MKQRDYQVVPFPRMRQIVIDSVQFGARKHTIHGLLEIDVTDARQRLHQHKIETGESLSFTAFIIACLGKAVGENKYLHAYRNWRGQLVLFDDVDITTIVEVGIGEHKFPLAHVVRAANHRSFRQIHDEIRAVQSTPEKKLGPQRWRWPLALFLLLPGFLRQLAYRVVHRQPRLVRQIGTVAITAVGMFGHGGGWGISIPLHTLSLTLGGISEKPGIVDGRIEIREYLHVTASFDHDIIDGAPAARFTQRLKELIEGGYGLDDA